jgi:hypothetical protein
MKVTYLGEGWNPVTDETGLFEFEEEVLFSVEDEFDESVMNNLPFHLALFELNTRIKSKNLCDMEYYNKKDENGEYAHEVTRKAYEEFKKRMCLGFNS